MRKPAAVTNGNVAKRKCFGNLLQSMSLLAVFVLVTCQESPEIQKRRRERCQSSAEKIFTGLEDDAVQRPDAYDFKIFATKSILEGIVDEIALQEKIFKIHENSRIKQATTSALILATDLDSFQVQVEKSIAALNLDASQSTFVRRQAADYIAYISSIKEPRSRVRAVPLSRNPEIFASDIYLVGALILDDKVYDASYYLSMLWTPMLKRNFPNMEEISPYVILHQIEHNSRPINRQIPTFQRLALFFNYLFHANFENKPIRSYVGESITLRAPLAKHLCELDFETLQRSLDEFLGEVEGGSINAEQE